LRRDRAARRRRGPAAVAASVARVRVRGGARAALPAARQDRRGRDGRGAAMRVTQGVTLLEVLLSVALIGAIVGGSGFWVREAAVRSKVVAEALRSESASEAFLRSIKCDLDLGDLALPSDKIQKVRVADGTLAIVTRSLTSDAGAIVHKY